MTKSENRELDTIRRYLSAGMKDTAARALSALVRSTRNRNTSHALMALAIDWGLITNEEFII